MSLTGGALRRPPPMNADLLSSSDSDDEENDIGNVTNLNKNQTKGRQGQQNTQNSAGRIKREVISSFEHIRNSNNNGVSSESCEGAILKLELIDFLCHEKLSVDFNKGMNFIIGQNGSGKSAIAAAIQCALGVRASDTGRGANAASQVRHGSKDRVAFVRLTLCNEGANAFFPEKFGPKIIIQRRIALPMSTTGKMVAQNTLKIKNAQGTDVAFDGMTSKQVLRRIIDTFNLQVSNPLVVISQEKMKEFAQANPTKHYDLFMAACQLTNMYEGIQKAHNNILASKTDIESSRHSDHMTAIELDYRQAELEKNRLAEAATLESDTKNAEQMLQWAEWAAVQRQAEELHQQIENAKQQADSASKAASDAVEAHRKAQAEFDAIEQAIQTDTREAEKFEEFANKCRTERSTILSDRDSVDRERRRRQARIEVLERSIESTRQKINELCNQDADKHGKPNVAVIQEQIDTLENEIEEQRNANATATSTCVKLQQELQDVHEEARTLRNDLKQAQNRLYGFNRQLEHSQSGAQDSDLALYPPGVADMYAFIQKNRTKFNVPPIGPCGKYIKLKDARYSNYSRATEHLGASILMCFLVDNRHDAKLLDEFNATVSRKASYIVLPKSDKLSNELVCSLSPPSHFTTLLQALEVTNDWVYNALCDACNFHRAILADDISSARKIRAETRQETNGQLSMPKNTFTVCLRDGSLYMARSNNEEITPYNRNAQLIDVSPVEQIERLKNDCNQAQVNISQLQGQLEKTTLQAQDLNRQIKKEREVANRATKTSTSLLRKQKTLRAQMRSLMEEQEDGNAQIDNAKHSFDLQQAELDNVKHQMQTLDQRISEYDKALQELDATVKRHNRADVRQRIEDASQQLQKLYDAMESAQRHAEKQSIRAKRKMETHDKYHAEYSTLCHQADRMKQTFQQDTHSDSPPIHEIPTVDVAKTDVERHKMRYEQYRREMAENNIDVNQVNERYDRTKATYEQAKAADERLHTLLPQLQRDASLRLTAWKEHRKQYAKIVSQEFSRLMKAKGHYGILTIRPSASDEASGQLDMSVSADAIARKQEFLQSQSASQSQSANPNQRIGIKRTAGQRSARSDMADIGTLSGGEKSYTTLSLLCALDAVIETPFRLLDEFDVYMDEATRLQAIKMLMQCARGNVGRQYFFVTPHDIRKALGDQVPEDVHILRLAPVEPV